MKFESAHQALATLENLSLPRGMREEAARYLSTLDDRYGAEKLVAALQNDHFGVRWEAANLLTRFGMVALPTLLEALTDPYKVADTRLREGVYHVLHYNVDPSVRALTHSLVNALKGQAADIESMREANRIRILLIKKNAALHNGSKH